MFLLRLEGTREPDIRAAHKECKQSFLVDGSIGRHDSLGHTDALERGLQRSWSADEIHWTFMGPRAG